MTAELTSGLGRVVLDDGRAVLARTICPEDAPALQRLHASLSPTTQRLRFFAAQPELSAAQAGYFCGVDHDEREALVAETQDGSVVAVVRYDRLPRTAAAEIALVVRDDFQQHHLGTLLLRELIELAAARGIHELLAQTLSQNLRVIHVMQAAGLDVQVRYAQGLAHLRAPIRQEGDR